jgi:hypothetical protein
VARAALWQQFVKRFGKDKASTKDWNDSDFLLIEMIDNGACQRRLNGFWR